MKKTWGVPVVEDLSIKMTALSPNITRSVDAEFIDDDGNKWRSTS